MVLMETVLAYFKTLFGHLLKKKNQSWPIRSNAPKYKQVKHYRSPAPAKILFHQMEL